eukprot:scaffold397_cov395-Pavlova_lutheri.AAC.12
MRQHPPHREFYGVQGGSTTKGPTRTTHLVPHTTRGIMDRAGEDRLEGSKRSRGGKEAQAQVSEEERRGRSAWSGGDRSWTIGILTGLDAATPPTTWLSS